MQIRLDSLGDEPFTWQETLEVDPADLGRSELQSLGPVSVNGRIERISTGYWLEVSLSVDETLECMRCLAPMVVAAESKIESLVTVNQKAVPESDKERELDKEELGVLNLREPNLETEHLLLEQLQLNLPMKPLCRDDCAGLCAMCGANRNDGECACASPVDPRWAALAALRNDPGQESSG